MNRNRRRGFAFEYTKKIKNLEDLRKLSWENIFQIDIGFGRKEETEFVLRITVCSNN